jgi:GNAT superfamily N-acetyltransferase
MLRTTLEILPAAAADDRALVDQLVTIINRAFALREKGLFRGEVVRTSPEEVAAIVRASEMVVARVGPDLAGCVRVHEPESGVGEFALLATSVDRRGVGIGRALVHFAERVNRQRGATRLQLEHLVPRHGTHAAKERLTAWYTRLGYRLCDRLDFAATHPEWPPLLAQPCDLLRYRKLA